MIRQFQTTDSAECAKIINMCHRSMADLDEDQIEFLLKKYTSEYLKKEYKKHHALVYEENGKILGVGTLIIKDAEIRGLYIDPRFHGKGIGSQLLRELEEEAKRQNISKVHVKSYFKPESFYNKCGYNKIEKGEIQRGTVKFPFVSMEKKV